MPKKGGANNRGNSNKPNSFGNAPKVPQSNNLNGFSVNKPLLSASNNAGREAKGLSVNKPLLPASNNAGRGANGLSVNKPLLPASNNAGRGTNNAGKGSNNPGRGTNGNNSGIGTNNTVKGSNNASRGTNGNNAGRGTNGNNSSRGTNGNNAVEGNNVSKPTDYTVIIIIVISIVVVAILGFVAYKYITNKKKVGIKTNELIPYIHDAKTMTRFSHGSIPASTEKNSYNYNCWIYINDYDYRSAEDKCILFKGSKGKSVHNNNTKENPGVYLLKNTNTLRVLISLDTSYNPIEKAVCSEEENIVSVEGDNVANNAMPLNVEGFVGRHSNDNVKPGCDHCDIEFFPLQKWVSLNISITDNVLDISLDGKLAKSCVLSGSPSINNRDLLVCPEGGFNGFISNLKVSNKALPVKDIQKLYKNGPNLKPGLLN